MGKHRGPDVPATRWPSITPTRNRIAVLALTVLGLTVCSVVGIGTGSAPDGRAAASAPMSFPTADQADDPGARGGPIAGPLALPELVSAGTPVWEPAKGTLIADGKPLPRNTGSTATRSTRATAPPQATGPTAPPTTTPPPPPPVIVEPPRDCADPLVECACDHDVDFDCSGNPRTPIGLPPVIVEEEPAVDEQPPADPPPAADDDPVIDIGILTPDPADEATP